MHPIYTVICWGVTGHDGRLEARSLTWAVTYNESEVPSAMSSAVKHCAKETVEEGETPRRIYQTDKPDGCKERFLRDYQGGMT